MSAHAAGILMIGLAVIIVLARLLGTLFRRIGQPPVVGEIIAGILVGPSIFGTHITDRLFPAAEVRPALGGLANVGLALFMFIVGYELDQSLIRGRERVAVSVSVGSIALPFGLGAVLALWLADRHDVHKVLPFALFLGASMSITAFPVLARILADRGMHRIQLGGLALASAAVDDLIAWSLLAVVVTVAGASTGQWHILLALPYLLFMFLVLRPLLRRLAAARDAAGRLTPNILAVVLVGLLASAFATEWLGVHFIFGAFLFGAVMPRLGGEQLRHEIMERLEQVSVLLLLPVYFVLSGMKVDLSTVDLSGLLELVAILVVAIGGKFLGAFFGARLQGVRNRQAGALATLMNTRGLTEIVILTVGLQLGILNTKLFSLMVVMALVTTVMTGPLLGLIYSKRRVDRDIAEAEKAALGIAEAYRVLVVVQSPTGDADRLALAGDLAADLSGGPRPEPAVPAEVVLSHLVPYRRPGRLEVGAGLSGELLELTRVMGELEQLAQPVRARGLAAPVLARFAADPVAELPDQVRSSDPDVLVVAGDHPAYESLREAAAGRLVTLLAPAPEHPSAVLVRGSGGPDGDAAVQVAAQLAAARGVPLRVSADGRTGRRLAGVLAELTAHGVPAELAGTAPAAGDELVVAAEGGAREGVHVLVRERPETELAQPSVWVPLLPRAEQSAVPAT
jgi:Kef-type K+ transport system membrane component KefB